MVSDHDTVGYQHHDHRLCIDEAMATARQICVNNGLRLTPLREQVLTFIWQSHRPLGAYDLLALLAEQTAGDQRKPAPPTIYRALDFLQAHGLVHRISSLNAYIGCCRPARDHSSQFLICRQCKTTVEIADERIRHSIQTTAQEAGFQRESECVEISGLCPNCQGQADHE
jgi:Fur family zinc uptake transcriptional regulator